MDYFGFLCFVELIGCGCALGFCLLVLSRFVDVCSCSMFPSVCRNFDLIAAG